MIRKHLIFLVAAFLLVPYFTAKATGIKASPVKFDFKARPGSVIKGELIIANPTDKVALYEITSDSLRSHIFFSRRSFVLESSQQSRAVFEIRDLESGQYSFNFNLVALPLSSPQTQLVAASGVKIPVNIEVSGSMVIPWTKIVYSLDAIFALLLILILARVLPWNRGDLRQVRP